MRAGKSSWDGRVTRLGMYAANVRWLASTLALLVPVARAAKGTTVVAVTATTTVTQRATDHGAHGACDNFHGACVVYGGVGNPSYTTTVYATEEAPSTVSISASPTATVTSYSTATAVEVRTTTVSNSNDCSNHDGACVVYGSAGGATATTVYSASSQTTTGNSGGYIGKSGTAGNEGAIGAAAASAAEIGRPAMAAAAIGVVGVIICLL